MSAARDEMLARIRRSLPDVPAAERPDTVAVQRRRTWRRSEAGRAELVEEFAAIAGEYGATVRRVAADELGRELTGECVRLGLHRIVVPPALPHAWRPDGVERGRGSRVERL